MYKDTLISTGLSEEEAEIYAILLKKGPLPAGTINKETPIKRGLVYKTLDRLVEAGLVKKHDEDGKVAMFTPSHPSSLVSILEEKQRVLEASRTHLNTALQSMSSDYNLSSGKPGIQFFEGINGMKNIYDDILAIGKDFHLVRSIFEPTYKNKVEPVVLDFIKKRVRKGNWAIALTPNDLSNEERENLKTKDEEHLMNRTFVDVNQYTSPVEIDIYDNKVAFLSFGKELIGTIIESPQIAQAMRELFMLAKGGANVTAKDPSQETRKV